MIQLSCSSTAFAHRDLAEAAARIAGLGFTSIDILVREGWAHIDPSQLGKGDERTIRQVAELLEEHGLTASGLNMALTTPLARCAVPLGNRETAEFEGILQLAVAMGSPVITYGPGRMDERVGLDRSLLQAGRVLHELVRRAQDRGVRLAVEIHARSLIEQIESAWTVAELAPGLGFTVDPSHFACMEIPLSRVSEIASQVFHVHLRNGKAGDFHVPLAEGDIDFVAFKRLLFDVGYAGYAAIEYIATAERDVTDDIVALKALWEQAPDGGSKVRS